MRKLKLGKSVVEEGEGVCSAKTDEGLSGYRLVLSASVVCAHDHVGDWELWFTAPSRYTEECCTARCWLRKG